MIGISGWFESIFLFFFLHVVVVGLLIAARSIFFKEKKGKRKWSFHNWELYCKFTVHILASKG